MISMVSFCGRQEQTYNWNGRKALVAEYKHVAEKDRWLKMTRLNNSHYRMIGFDGSSSKRGC